MSFFIELIDNLIVIFSSRIWDRFLDFESCVGDLASILKVEKRRKTAYEEAQKDQTMNHSMLVIDRYKFMDLMPCSGEQLKLIGYNALVSEILQLYIAFY